MYLFIDIKTKGLPENVHKPLIYDLIDISITEIAWLLIDSKKKVIKKKHYKAYQKGFVSFKNYKKYSESSESSIVEPHSFEYIVESLLKSSLDKAKLIIYHDINLKDNLLNKLHFDELSESENPLMVKDRLCILEETFDLFTQESKNATHTLSSLHYQLFKKSLPEELDLTASINALSKCFFKLKDDKFLRLTKRRKYHSESKTLDEILPITIKSIKGTVYKVGSNEKIQSKQFVRNTYEITNQFKSYCNVLEIRNFNADGILTSWEEYIFMSSALRYVKLYSSKKGLLTTRQYKYNDEGNLSLIKYFSGEREFLGTKEYSYDDNGNLLSIFFNRTDFTLVETNLRYNGLGDSYVESCHISDENLDKEYVKIDTLGNVAETYRYIYTDAPKGIALSNKYRYNKNNLLAEKIFVKSVGKDCHIIKERKSTYEYNYDEKSNWIGRIESIDGVPSYSETREIEYFFKDFNYN